MLKEQNLIGSEGGLDWDIVIEMTNIMAWILIVAIVVAHTLWLTEKTNPESYSFEHGYLAGTFDATWALATGSLGQVTTPCGRIIGIVYQFGSMAMFALLAGTMSAMLTAAANEVDKFRWETSEDLPSSARVCCPTLGYLEYSSMQQVDAYYETSGLTFSDRIENCINDVYDGVADLMSFSEVGIRKALSSNSTRAHDFMILSGVDEMVVSTASAGDTRTLAVSTFEQAMIKQRDYYMQNLDEFFPPAGSRPAGQFIVAPMVHDHH